jgi:hypothetical protein
VHFSDPPSWLRPNTIADNPPGLYKGPIAEQPVLQQGDYWIYQTVSLARGKTATLAANIGFPLWLGKVWTYDGEPLLQGQPTTSKATRAPTKISCTTVGYREITVVAGTFSAFECECDCTVLSGTYDSFCGRWSFRYSPEVKNIVKRQTESTLTSVELVEYRGSRLAPGAKQPPRKRSWQCPAVERM